MPAAPGEPQSSYEATLRAHLSNFFFYPDAARSAGLHGTVQVRLNLSRDGRVLGAWVQQSSGETVLDAAALEVIRRAQPLPAIPRDLPDSLDVYLPLEYLPPKIVLGAR
jgi:protein TonB